MKKIILTGASGYIGSNFLNKFSNKYEFLLISKSDSFTKNLERFPSHKIIDIESITDKTFQNANIYAFVHLAAFGTYETSTSNINKLIAANIELPTKVLNSYTEAGGRNFLNIGTYWQHYENCSYYPNSLYAASKKAFEDIVDFYSLNKEVNAITLKLFETYGPNDPRPKLLKLIYDAQNNNKEIELTSGDQLVNYTHIDDIVSAIDVALNSFRAGHQKYLVKSSKDYQLKEIIEKFVQKNNIQIELKWGKRAHSKRDFFREIDIHPILPGWSATINIDIGLEKLYHP